MITKEQYYNLMQNMVQDSKDFPKIYEQWKLCFDYILRSFKCGYNKKSINHLFQRYGSANWNTKETTQYFDYSKSKLIKAFNDECFYICDRLSYDRLFRCHWLFNQAFSKELKSYVRKDN